MAAAASSRPGRSTTSSARARSTVANGDDAEHHRRPCHPAQVVGDDQGERGASRAEQHRDGGPPGEGRTSIALVNGHNSNPAWHIRSESYRCLDDGGFGRGGLGPPARADCE